VEGAGFLEDDEGLFLALRVDDSWREALIRLAMFELDCDGGKKKLFSFEMD